MEPQSKKDCRKREKTLENAYFQRFLVAGAEGLEPSARGFGDQVSICFYARIINDFESFNFLSTNFFHKTQENIGKNRKN